MASNPVQKTGNDGTTITRSSNIPVNKSKNEHTRSPEKPPVASKPKFAPPPPPKPTSLSPHSSLTSPIPQSNKKSPCILPYKSKDGGSSETKNNELKSYDQCVHGGDPLIAASSIPPPLPMSPPPLVGQHLLENSTSFSLPASFRNKNLRMVNLSAQSQILVSLSSSSSPTSLTSPISSSRSIDPSLSTRPQGSLQSPKISSRSCSEHEALSLKLPYNKTTTDSPPYPTKNKPEISLSHIKEAFTISEAQLERNEIILNSGGKLSQMQLNDNTQKSDLSEAIPDTLPLKMPHSFPDKPNSTPNQSPSRLDRPKRTSPFLSKLVSAPPQPEQSLVEKKISQPPSRPAPPVMKPKSSNFADSPLLASQQPIVATDIKFGTEVKSAPPPLPKNPPRGGVPRKPRSSTCKKTPTSETKPVFPGFQTNGGATDQTSLSSDPTRAGLAPGVTENNCSHLVIAAAISQDNFETVKITGPKVAPKPRPRTRLSLPLSSKSEQTLHDQSNNNITKDVSNDIGVDLATNDITSYNEDECQTPNGKPIELDYVEVYRGDSEDRDDPESAKSLNNNINSRSSDLKYSKISFGKSAIPDDSLEKTTIEQKVDANKSNSETFVIDQSSVLCVVNDNHGQEPEATCGMLKEIEELLKAKLGDLKLDAGDQDVKKTDSNPEYLTRDSPSSSPVRPPRPKRQASICRRKDTGSLESLTSSLDTSSSECIHTSGLTISGKKIPPKPKRTFVSRVNRSHSDVSGMKPDLGSTEDNTETDMNQNTPTTKPFLPPRSDSLKRSESCSSTVTPPPLPPRNKPQSMIQSPGGTSEAQKLHTADAETPVTRKTHLWDHEHNLDMSVVSGPSGTLRSSKIRPMRKAPPPPPGPPKRSSTFSPGDVKSQVNMETSEKETTSTRRLSIPDEHDYHEISDHFRTKREEGSPPPELPPRVSMSQTSEVSSPDLGRHEKSQSPSPEGSRIVLAKRLSPEDQRLREKRAKTALIQKVAQGLGLSKTSKKTRVAEINLPDTVSFNRNDHARSSSMSIDLTSRDSVIPEITSVPEVTIQDDTDGIPSADQTRCDSGNNSDQWAHIQASGSTSSSDRPPSMVSQHSSTSGVDGELQVFGSQNLEEMLTSGSESEPEPEPDKEEIYAQRKAKKVFFIAREIMSSESTFVDVLKLLNLDFRVHISNTTEKLGQPVIPSDTLNKILDFLPQLQNFNEELLKDFKDCVENWDVKPRISDVFVRKGPFLKLYSSYISNFENATAILENATKKHPAFSAALKEFEMSSRCASLALKHYMLKPIQRIPQYKLLLQDYLKNLSPASPDYKDTLTALDIVSKVADHANESMRHGDNVQKLLEIQRSLIGQFEVIQPGRILVKKGELQKVSRKEMQPRMFILFSDVLLYTTPTATGYKINNILPLIGMKVTSPKLEDYKYEFSIIGVQRSFTLCASTPKEKEEWVSALQLAIETNAKKQHTFEAVKQGQDSLLDKNFVLGTKAPLWVPDSRVTMCTLCLVEFTLTWRRHHCRSCGRIICSQCSDNKAPLRYLQNKPARVCDQCFETLQQELKKELEETVRKPSTSSSHTSDDPTSPKGTGQDLSEGAMGDDGGSISNLLSRFQKIRINKTKPNVQSRPSVLKEVHANDEGSALSGYLRAYKSRKWKRLWFVVKGQVLYTYRASEDMAAVESMPLLGYEVTRLNTAFEGADPDVLFELTHQNNQPLGNRNLGSEKTTQRLIFRTDTVAATVKWVSVLTEASCTHLT